MKPCNSIVAEAVARKGRGVFACEIIRSGDLVETAPTVELGHHDTDTLAATCLDDYYFAHPANPDGGLMVLGLASLCNHSDRPNVRTAARRDDRIGWVIELWALRDIAPGEEITRRYACNPWFETAD